MNSDLAPMLDQLDPAVLSYDEWLAVGMAVHHEGGTAEQWAAWSQRDPKRYIEGDCEARWKSFHGGGGKPVTIASLAKLVKDHGGTLPNHARAGGALNWDGTPVTLGQEPVAIDLADPPLDQYDGKADLRRYLTALFQPADIVGYVCEPKWNEKQQRWVPTSGVYTRTAGELLTALEDPAATLAGVLGNWNEEVGAWIRFNPLDGKGITDQNVTVCRYALVESDKISVEDQISIIRKLRLPVAALVSSAGKSAHAIVRVNASTLEEYAERVKLLYATCAAAGLKIDGANKNPSRLSRLPGVTRRGRPQRLLATSMGCTTWPEWIQAVAPVVPTVIPVVADGRATDPVQAAAVHRPLHMTDLGNSERFAFRGVTVLRHVTNVGWRHWDGRRWALDAEGKHASELVKEAVLNILREAAAIKGDDDATKAMRKELVKWAFASESRSRIVAALELARPHPALSAEVAEFDLDPWLFNCQNGTVNLKTGELRDHRREDRITRISPVAYDPAAVSDVWSRFLDSTTAGDTSLSGFLARAIGYSLTGDVSEEKLFFIHGPEATGKSTAIEAVKTILGDYGLTADFDMLLKRKQAGGIRNDLARLAGARFVASVEVDEGKELAEGIVKSLTGNDTVSARHLYREFFDFKPQFKLWLAANHAPTVNSDDLAMWRRILRVPFEHTVPKEKRDPRVKAALRSATVGGPAILAWAVRGCLEWQQNGLGVPDIIEVATEAYRHDCDSLAAFFDEKCTFAPDVWEESSLLRTAYENWADANHVQPKYRVSPRTFAEKLKLRGCLTKTVGHSNARVWHGIELSAASQQRDSASGCEHMRAHVAQTPPNTVIREDFTQVALASARMCSPEAENGHSETTAALPVDAVSPPAAPPVETSATVQDAEHKEAWV